VSVPLRAETVISALTQRAESVIPEILSCSYYLVFYPDDVCNYQVLIAQRTQCLYIKVVRRMMLYQNVRYSLSVL